MVGAALSGAPLFHGPYRLARCQGTESCKDGQHPAILRLAKTAVRRESAMLVPSMLRLRASLLTRLVVAALLFWAATDLAFPQLCAEDSPVSAQTRNSSAGDASAQQDDCFCCCQHVVPVTVSFSAALVGLTELFDAQPPASPLGIARPIFHPPLSL